MSTSRSIDSAAAMASIIPERSRAVSSRLLAASTFLSAADVKKSEVSFTASSCAALMSARGTFTAATSSDAALSTSQESSRASMPIVSTMRRRTWRRLVELRNSQARAGVPATASEMRASRSLAPDSRSTALSAASGEVTRKGTTWQRDTIVGSIAATVRPHRMKTTPSGGSSRVLSRAFAAVPRRRSARSMT